MVKGSTVMVLDCGGGTVDITIHKLTCNPDERFVCEELLPSSGGCEWGSKYVDLYFEEFVRDFFGEELFKVYRSNAMARLDILKHFEMLKRKFNPGVDERSRLQLSYLGEELSAGKLGELVKEYNKKLGGDQSNHIKQRGASSIDLPPILMLSFFKPLFDNIKAKVQSLIEQANAKDSPVNFIFMVGGFSESPFLKAEVKKNFEEGHNIAVLVPRRP
jgi:molecular chaperone DnaK (HSP70)